MSKDYTIFAIESLVTPSVYDATALYSTKMHADIAITLLFSYYEGSKIDN